MTFRLHFNPSGETLAAARACEQAVFLDVYGNTAAEWVEEYGRYEPASVFVCVQEAGGEVVASARLIVPNEAGFKSLVDAARSPWFVDGERAARAAGVDLGRTWDVATIAVRKNAARSGLLAAALYHGVYRAATLNGIRWLVMIMDVRARRLLRMLQLETNVLPSAEPGPYLGSASSVPLWADIDAMWDLQFRADPQSHRLVTMGVGLDGITLPDRAGFLLNPAGQPVPDDTVRVGRGARELTGR